MNRSAVYFLIIIVLLSCQKKAKQIDVAKELRGNTYSMTSDTDQDTLFIEFKDSTYTVFEYRDQNLPWRISNFNNSDVLVFDRSVMAIKQSEKGNFEGLIFAEKDYKIYLKNRANKWDKELLNGIWVEEKYFDHFSNDSITIPPPPPLPDEIGKDYQWPPFYKITDNTISCKYNYLISESEIEINNSVEFIILKIKSANNIEERLWKIKTLTDSIMIVDKVIEKQNGWNDFTTNTIKNIKLIKKIN